MNPPSQPPASGEGCALMFAGGLVCIVSALLSLFTRGPWVFILALCGVIACLPDRKLRPIFLGFILTAGVTLITVILVCGSAMRGL